MRPHLAPALAAPRIISMCTPVRKSFTALRRRAVGLRSTLTNDLPSRSAA